jgi:hypothetical protein
MDPTTPTTAIPSTSPAKPRKQRLESVRPFAQKYQYRQLPFPELVKPAETPGPTAPVPAEDEAETKAQETL